MQLAVLQYILSPLIAGVLGALLSTYFNAHFNFRRFRKEQWWQAKREAYEAIIKKLSETLFEIGRQIADIETSGTAVPLEAPVRQRELAWSLQEIASGGAYIVSEHAAKAVAEAVNKIGNYVSNDYYAHLSHDYDIAKKALDVVRNEAHRDLGVM